MGLLKALGHIAKGAFDVVTGNIPGAIGEGVSLFGSGHHGAAPSPTPKLVRATPGTSNTSYFSGLPVTITNPNNSAPSAGNFSGFLNWLKNKGTTSDIISLAAQFITSPFSGWPSHIQALYRQYQNSLIAPGGGSSSGGSSGVPALPGMTAINPVEPVTFTTKVERAPSGYVTVEYQGQKVYMLKVLARKYGLWKPRKKPPISVSEWESAKNWQKAQRRVKKVAGEVGLTTHEKGRSTSRKPSRSQIKEIAEAVVIEERKR